MKRHPHAGVEAEIQGFAKQFDIPVALAREAFRLNNDNYTKAYEYVREKILRSAR